ncbi:MAG: hypothetical protein A2341_00395 [Deltaproteobacteria bacterium RIFOXYB12_FULL_58_9]|nr:MAG: hypothetical protein A2341_00395 [Deltaproteobacteria bacterium RIFOXYB12_FULL_58_9]
MGDLYHAPPSLSQHKTSTENLFGKLRVALVNHGILDFAVYTVEQGEARLAFSSGVAIQLGGQDDGRLSIAEHPALKTLLQQKQLILRAVKSGPPLLEDRDGVRTSPTAILRLGTANDTDGFILLYGESSSELLAESHREELESLLALFGADFSKQRAIDSMHREHQQTRLKLRELREGLELLLFDNYQEMLGTLITRALEVAGARAGEIRLQGIHTGVSEFVVGDISTSAAEELARIEGANELQGPALVSSLTGEVTTRFDLDTIHIASVAVFPLVTRSGNLGWLILYDAALSGDAVDLLESLALVAATALENWRNSQRMLEQHRMQEQLAVVAALQQRLLPSKRIVLEHLSVAHYSQYCDETGGDYVDAIVGQIPGLCHFVVGDVSGHGLGAAMLMVDVRARLRSHLENRPLCSPTMVLEKLNTSLCRESAPQEFVTLFMCRVDTRMGTLSYASAGHEPPLLFDGVKRQWQELPSTGLPLGLEEEATFPTRRVQLNPGDVLVLATDGATEAEDANESQFGVDVLKEVIAASPEASAAQLRDALVMRTLDHCGGRPFVDDVTYLVLKIEKVVLRVAPDELPAPPSAPPLLQLVVQPGPEQPDRCIGECTAALLECAARGPAFAHAVDDVIICLGEAVDNAITHGSQSQSEARVVVRIWSFENQIEMRIEDPGVGFSPRDALATEVREEALDARRGRGLQIMISLMDEVGFNARGNVLHMIKSLKSES